MMAVVMTNGNRPIRRFGLPWSAIFLLLRFVLLCPLFDPHALGLAMQDETVGDLMRLSGYQAHKQEVTAHVTRGVFRRARMSRWEAGRVAGVLRAARDRLASSSPSRDGD